MSGFHLRRYHRPAELGGDLGRLLKRWREIGPLMRGESLDPAFRERLMLAVTAVNQCRYCSYAHARLALREGLAKDEINQLLQGELQNSPPSERAALLYAQHWAESNGQVDAQAREALFLEYTPEQVNSIELAIQIMRLANLSGNTLDFLLYRLSFGHWRGKQTASNNQAG